MDSLNEDEAQLVRTLSIILFGLLAAAAAAMLLLLAEGELHQVGALSVGAVALVLALWLARRGHPRAAGFLMLADMTALATYLLVIADGLQDIAILIYPATILAASLLLQRRMFVMLVGLILAVLGLIAHGQVAGWVNNLKPVPEHVYADYAFALVILSLTALTAHLLAENVRRNLERARRNERALKETVGQLQHEIAGRRLAQERLAASEERYRLFIAQSSEGIWRFDHDQPISTSLPVDEQVAQMFQQACLAECNDAFARMYGYARAADLLGKRLGDLVPRDDPANLEYLRNFVRAGYRLENAESHELDSAGRSRYFLNNMLGIVAAGQLVRTWGTQRDVTESRQAEAALREAELRFRTLVEQTSVVIYRDAPDPQAGALYISPQIENLIGYSPAEWTADPYFWHNLLHPEDRERVLAAVGRYLSSDSASISEYRLKARDGGWVWVQDESVIVRDEAGQPRYVQGVLSNITERKRAEAARQEAELRFRTLVEQIPAITYLDHADPRARSVYVSPQVQTMLGVSPEEWREGELNFWLGLIHPEEREAARAAYLHSIESGAPFNLEYRMRARDGRELWVFDRAVVMPGLGGQPGSIHGVIFDITDRKRAEGEVRRLNTELEGRVAQRTAELEAALRELESFAYTVWHDLRSPLRAMNGYAHLLSEEYAAGLDERGQQHLGRIRAGAQRMDLLIQDLLAFIRLGRLPVQPQPVAAAALREMVALLVDELQAEAGERQVEVIIGPLPECRADPVSLRSVFTNLLSNAFKFTRRRADARVEVGSRPAPGGVIYFVRDNGVGFDVQYLPKLFGVFQRLHLTDDFEGTGVGLAIVRRAVERHGGRVWAEAEPGRGATFYFMLPHPVSEA
jgi:PAS domain S-box-containing protein